MNDNLNPAFQTTASGQARRSANPSYYLDRKSATILMLIKLAEGLSKLSLVIISGFLLQSVVTALNRIFQEGSTVADGKAMLAQFLKTLQFPAETIRQIVDAFPLNVTFSSKPVVYVFVISLPFVLIAVLEAIAAIRLRLGKGGTRTIEILQMVYFVLRAIGLFVCALTAIVLSVFTILRVGGGLSIMLSTVYVSLAVFFILIGLPELLYHRNLARIMGDVRYEMETGKEAVRRRLFFKENLIVLIVLEVIGTVVSLLSSGSPRLGGVGTAMLIAAMVGPAAKLLKYICVMCCHRNYMHEDKATQEGKVSHMPQIILILLVVLFFAIPNVFLCIQSKTISDTIVKGVEDFFSNARQTVDEVSTTAQAEIDAVKSVLNGETEVRGAAPAPQDGTKEEAKEGTAEIPAPPQEAGKEEAAEAPAAPAAPAAAVSA